MLSVTNQRRSLLPSALLLLLCILSGPASGAQHSATGTVALLRTHDSTLVGDHMDWLAVDGFTSAGTCQTAFGYIVMRIRDDSKGSRMFSLALAAATAGAPVWVTVDEAHKDTGGHCYLLHVDIQP